MLQWIAAAGLTMSLGWGLRGYIGGGPLGAMIPGAMLAMVLCLFLRRDGYDAGVIAAFGAVGIGFGGEMTYGQTIGLTLQSDTRWWGLLGLFVKGAVWGFLGGAVLGLGFVREQYHRRDLTVGFVLLIAGVFAGWKLVNEPKLIYFSNPFDRPRPEIWAGLLIGGVLLLGWFSLRGHLRVPLAFALAGLTGGGAGFFLGGCLQAWGRTHWPSPLIDWWKGMEFTFGLLLGTALGWCAWRMREQLSVECHAPSGRSRWSYVASTALGAILVLDMLPFRFSYILAAVLLLAGCLRTAGLGWHVAITLTATAFTMDLAGAPGALVAIPAALIVEWNRSVWPIFQLLLFGAIADSMLKSLLLPFRAQHWLVEATFIIMAVLLWRSLPHIVSNPHAEFSSERQRLLTADVSQP
jgi:hypothetical protein